MKRIIIIGGGFAGLAAAQRLSKESRRFEVILLDPRESSHFLPLLPDLVGRNLDPRNLCYPLAVAAKRWQFSHQQAHVLAVDVVNRVVETSVGRLPFDYLIVAAGTRTNTYGRSDLAQFALPLHSVDDAVKIRSVLDDSRYASVVVAGGGYTGVEIATQLWRGARRTGRPLTVYLVERGLAVCASLPEPFQNYIAKNLESLGIRVLTNCSVESVTEDVVCLAGHEPLRNSRLIWTAGVCAPDFVRSFPGEKNPLGCLLVDDYLRIAEGIFAIGDIASVVWQGKPLRMGVQFSLAQGQCAVENILRMEARRSLQAYRPNDLGYVVPMANGRACGTVLGTDLYGRLPSLLHYAMSGLRSYGWKNRYAITCEVLHPR